MPKIPVYTPQVRNEDMPGIPNEPQASGDAFGANIGAALGRGIDTSGFQGALYLNQIESLRQDKDFARDSLNQLQLNTSKFLTDSVNKSPKENLNLLTDLDSMLKDQYKQQIKGMSPKQQEIFSAGFSDYANDYRSRAYQLQSKAKQNFEISTITGQNDLTFRDYYSGIISYDTMKKTISPNLAYLAKNMSDAERKAFIEDSYTKLHAQYAEGLSKSNPLSAIAYMDRYKDDMNPVTFDIEKTKLMKYAKEVELQESRTPADYKLYNSLNNLPWQQLRDIDLSDPRYDSLTGEHRKYIVNTQNSLRTGDTQTIKDKEFKTQISTGFKGLGFTQKQITEDPEVQTKLAQYTDQVNSYINTLPKDKRSRVDIDNAIKYMNAPVIISESFLPFGLGDKIAKRWEVPYLTPEEKTSAATEEVKQTIKDNSYAPIVEATLRNDPQNVIKEGNNITIVKPDGSEQIYKPGDNNPEIIRPSKSRYIEKSKQVRKPGTGMTLPSIPFQIIHPK